MENSNNLIEIKEERNYGIDLLRIVAMFFVVVLHSFGHGGILDNVAENTVQYRLAWFIEIFAFCAVDIFALISGYVLYSDKEKKIKYSNYFNLWFQVAFYGLVITSIFHIFNITNITKGNYFKAILPVTTNSSYWYFTAYTGLFILMPFLNKGIKNCSDGVLKKFFIVIILIFSIFVTITKRFNIENGYSFIWLIMLYVLGAIIKKCKIGKNMKWYHAIIGIWLLGIVTILYKLYGFEMKELNIVITKDLLINYTSPTILGMAILYVITFSKFKFGNKLKKTIKFSASSAFAVYLINDNFLVRANFIRNLFANIANDSLVKIIVYPIGFAILFVICSILIDKVRIGIFKLCRIKKFSNKIGELLDKFLSKNINYI